MKELILWKEVDVKDATNSIKISDEVFGGIVFVKRVVIPILSDQEMEEDAKIELNKLYKNDYALKRMKEQPKNHWPIHWLQLLGFYKTIVKAMQERLIGGEGL